MSTVAIIGAGDVASAAAQALAAREHVQRVVLIDQAAKVAAGKALDIQQSGAVDRFHTVLDATDDLSRVTGANVCIVADRVGGGEWQGEDGLAMLGRLLGYVSGAPLVFAGAQQVEMMLAAARERGLRRHAMIGSAAEAFASAIRAIVALEAQCSVREVSLAVLGTPSGFVIPWSEAAIGGYALERVLSQVQITRVEARSTRLWPPGPYTLGIAAAEAAGAIVGASRQTLSAFTLLAGEFGVRNRIGALPVLLDKRGIAQVRVPTLNTRERVSVETSLSV